MILPLDIRRRISPVCQACRLFRARHLCDERGCGLMLCPACVTSGAAGDGCPEHAPQGQPLSAAGQPEDVQPMPETPPSPSDPIRGPGIGNLARGVEAGSGGWAA